MKARPSYIYTEFLLQSLAYNQWNTSDTINETNELRIGILDPTCSVTSKMAGTMSNWVSASWPHCLFDLKQTAWLPYSLSWGISENAQVPFKDIASL